MFFLFQHALSFLSLIAALFSGGVLLEAAAPRASIAAYRQLTRAVLGLLFWIATIFLMAVAHVLHPWTLRSLAVLVVCGAAMVLRRRRLALAIGHGPAPWWSVALPLASLGFVLASLLMMGMRPGVAWDAGTYHLTVPRLYLEHGGFRPIQFNVYSNWPLNQELLFALGLALHDYFLATLVQWLFAALTVWALIAACRVHEQPWAGPIAACLFLANGVVLFEAGVAYVDLGLAFFFFMALVYALHAERVAEERIVALVLSGICCGLMAGIKLVGIFGLGCVGVIVAWQAVRSRGVVSGVKDTARYFVIPCLLLAVPWYLKSAWYTGNPFYPFLFETFRGIEWSAPLGEQFNRWQASLGMGRAPLDYLLLPVRFALQGGEGYQRFDGRISWTWLVVVPLVVAGCWRSQIVRRAGVVASLYFVCWAISSQQARFFIPALAVLSFAGAFASAVWIDRLPASAVRMAAQLTLAAVASALLLSTARDTTDEAGRWWHRWRLRELSEVLDAGVPPVFRFVNSNLPDDARLLFLDVNQGFFCDRDYVADSFFEASQVNALLLRNRRADQIQSTLLGERFTHVLVGRNRWGIPYPPTLDEFFATRSRLIHTSAQGDLVYEIVRP